MAVRDLTSNPIEKSRDKIDDRTILSTYQIGRGEVVVRSVFGTEHTYADLMRKIVELKHKLQGQHDS